MPRTACAALLATAILTSTPALADQPAAATASPAPATPTPATPKTEFDGPLVPGICLISREQVFADSKVGQAAKARLEELGRRAKAGLEAERRKLEAEAKALQAQQGTLTPAQGQHRQQQLQARAQGLQSSAGQIGRELEATRLKATEQLAEAMRPIAVEAYQAKGCGLLLSREAVVGGNLGNDLTAAVIRGLDAKITTITFEREHLPPSAENDR
jgi:Skp family chaperone for outer membrane proteins